MHKERNIQIDNLRAVLMILVVVGHFCEKLIFPFSDVLFKLIYAFHMPAFAFLTGVCSKPDAPKKVAQRFLYPYFVFQLLLFLFRRYALGVSFQFDIFTPIRSLWFLLSVAAWKLALPLFDLPLPRQRRLAVFLSVFICLAAGGFSEFDRAFSLSRTLVFFPFFLVGYYLRSRVFSLSEQRISRGVRLGAAAVTASIFLVLYAYAERIDRSWLYGAVGYTFANYDAIVRAVLFAAAAILTLCLLLLVPRRRLPLLTVLGQRTMPVYLLHSFVALTAEKFTATLSGSVWICLLLSVFCLVLFSAKPVISFTAPLMSWPHRKKRTADMASAQTVSGK